MSLFSLFTRDTTASHTTAAFRNRVSSRHTVPVHFGCPRADQRRRDYTRAARTRFVCVDRRRLFSRCVRLEYRRRKTRFPRCPANFITVYPNRVQVFTTAYYTSRMPACTTYVRYRFCCSPACTFRRRFPSVCV